VQVINSPVSAIPVFACSPPSLSSKGHQGSGIKLV
jgi:hypothetical protein